MLATPRRPGAALSKLGQPPAGRLYRLGGRIATIPDRLCMPRRSCHGPQICSLRLRSPPPAGWPSVTSASPSPVTHNDTNSPERQRANIQALCEAQRLDCPNGTSTPKATSPGVHENNRPAWLSLKARLGDPDVVALVANDLARLHRKALACRTHRGAARRRRRPSRLRCARPRDRHLATPQGRMLVNFLAMLDEAYANDISQRAQDSVAHRKARGVTIGLPPFGTTRDKQTAFSSRPTEGAWQLPDGTYVAGTAEEPPQPRGALARLLRLRRAHPDRLRRQPARLQPHRQTAHPGRLVLPRPLGPTAPAQQ